MHVTRAWNPCVARLHQTATSRKAGVAMQLKWLPKHSCVTIWEMSVTACSLERIFLLDKWGELAVSTAVCVLCAPAFRDLFLSQLYREYSCSLCRQLNRVTLPLAADTPGAASKSYEHKFWNSHPFPTVADAVQTEVNEYQRQLCSLIHFLVLFKTVPCQSWLN